MQAQREKTENRERYHRQYKLKRRFLKPKVGLYASSDGIKSYSQLPSVKERNMDAHRGLLHLMLLFKKEQLCIEVHTAYSV